MTEETYTPEEDVTEEVDGVQRQVAAKGIPMPMEEARRRGLVKDARQMGPRETKEEAPGAAQQAQDAPEEAEPAPTPLRRAGRESRGEREG